MTLVAASTLLSSCQPQAPAADVIKPEMLVHWDGPANVFCKSRETLAEFVGHSSRGEATKGRAMLGGDGPCRVMGDPHATGKVLSLGILDGGVAIVELAPAGNGESNGFWTLEANLRAGPAP